VGEAPNPHPSGFGDLFRYADAEDAGSNTLVKQPVAVYVEKVYEEGDFSALGIGT